MSYRTNLNVPKPSDKLQVGCLADLNTVYLQPETTVELAEEPSCLSLLNPEYDYECDTISLNKTRAIFALEPCNIDGKALFAILRAKVPVILFSQSGEFLGRIDPDYSEKDNILKAQAKITEEQSVQILQAVCWGVLRRCRRYLLRNSNSRNIDIAQQSQELQIIIDSIYKQSSVLSLQGLLGSGLKIYYEVLPLCLSHDWKFGSRHDGTPVSRMLDYSYKLLEQSTKNAVYAVGLNPNIGFWHTTHHSQKALIADIASELKLYSEAVVIRVLNKGQIVPKDFDDCWLDKTLPAIAVKAISRSFQQKMNEKITYPHTTLKCSYQELLYLQSLQVAWFLCGEISEYYSPDLK